MLPVKPCFHLFLRFAVFGLGSSAYPNYCAFSERIDDLLAKMNFVRLLDLHTGDEQKNQDYAFRQWADEIFAVDISSSLPLTHAQY